MRGMPPPENTQWPLGHRGILMPSGEWETRKKKVPMWAGAVEPDYEGEERLL